MQIVQTWESELSPLIKVMNKDSNKLKANYNSLFCVCFLTGQSQSPALVCHVTLGCDTDGSLVAFINGRTSR